ALRILPIPGSPGHAQIAAMASDAGSAPAFAPIFKAAAAGVAAPYLQEWSAARRNFSWAAARAELSAASGPQLNIAHEALHRHVDAGRGSRLAMRFVDRNWRCTDLKY